MLIGSGNKGNLYRVEERSLYSTLVSLPVAQITALLPANDGTLYAATGNVGKVFRAWARAMSWKELSRAMCSIPAVSPRGDG